MRQAKTPECRQALRDFALSSGYLVVIAVDADGRVADYNRADARTLELRNTPRAAHFTLEQKQGRGENDGTRQWRPPPASRQPTGSEQEP